MILYVCRGWICRNRNPRGIFPTKNSPIKQDDFVCPWWRLKKDFQFSFPWRVIQVNFCCFRMNSVFSLFIFRLQQSVSPITILHHTLPAFDRQTEFLPNLKLGEKLFVVPDYPKIQLNGAWGPFWRPFPVTKDKIFGFFNVETKIYIRVTVNVSFKKANYSMGSWFSWFHVQLEKASVDHKSLRWKCFAFA